MNKCPERRTSDKTECLCSIETFPKSPIYQELAELQLMEDVAICVEYHRWQGESKVKEYHDTK